MLIIFISEIIGKSWNEEIAKLRRKVNSNPGKTLAFFSARVLNKIHGIKSMINIINERLWVRNKAAREKERKIRCFSFPDSRCCSKKSTQSG